MNQPLKVANTMVNISTRKFE